MSTTICNLSGTSAHLLQGGSLLADIPSGYTGSLTLTGSVSVVLQNVQVISTNFATLTNGHLAVSWSGPTSDSQMSDGYNIHGQTGTMTMAPGDPLYFRQYLTFGFANWQTIGNVGNYLWQNYTITDGAGTLNIAISNGPVVGSVLSVTTNTGELNLGSFQASGFVRALEIQSASFGVQTYADHCDAAAWGFAVGFAVFITRWLLNVVGSMGREEDL